MDGQNSETKLGWYAKHGESDDIIVSSRVRLARNFSNIPFPHASISENAQQVTEIAKQATAIYNETHSDNPLFYVEMNELPQKDREYLVETHTISNDLVKSRDGALSATRDDSLAVMINEEDHLRIQSIMPGLAVKEAYEKCLEFESMEFLDKKYAFHDEFGYLTSCPTNAGTGLRVSVMLHLPAAELSGNLETVLKWCNDRGINVRGIYGENSRSEASLYQISNRVTLGRSEQEIIDMMSNDIGQIYKFEQECREYLLKEKPDIDDRICRAYGLLSSAKSISSAEATGYISLVKLGLDTGILKGVQSCQMINLLINIQPAGMQKLLGKTFSPEQRDRARALFIRNKMKEIEIGE